MSRMMTVVSCRACGLTWEKRTDTVKAWSGYCRSCSSKKARADLPDAVNQSLSEKARAQRLAHGGRLGSPIRPRGEQSHRWKGGLPKCACGTQLSSRASTRCRPCSYEARRGVKRASRGRAPCSVDKCDRQAQGRGLCKAHWGQWRNGREIVPFAAKAGVDQRIQSQVIQRPTGCQEWQGATVYGGYGVIRHEGKLWRVHRLVWTITFGPIPTGISVCHRCDNPPCANPEHLFLGSHQDNMRDMAEKGRAGSPGLFGEIHPRARLTEAIVLHIRAHSEVSDGDFAIKYDVAPSTIAAARRGRNWKYLTNGA